MAEGGQGINFIPHAWWTLKGVDLLAANRPLILQVNLIGSWMLWKMNIYIYIYDKHKLMSYSIYEIFFLQKFL